MIYNIHGVWNSLIAMLDDLAQKGMVRGEWKRHIVVANTFDEVKRAVEGDFGR